MRSQSDDMFWRPGPKDQTIPRIRKPTLRLELEKDLVDEDLLELAREEFVLLLLISGHSVRGV